VIFYERGERRSAVCDAFEDEFRNFVDSGLAVTAVSRR
jgi:hypothetical protein